MPSSVFALLDDIATLLDDIAAMTKVAGSKTAGVVGDDLALNAHQVTGLHAERELPVVWAVAKGSLINKAILVPAALAIATLERWMMAQGWEIPLISSMLMLGGTYLCYEGVEKLAHPLLHKADAQAHEQALQHALGDPSVDLLALEQDKIRGAIRTDFILSAEIIVIALGTVATQPLLVQVGVLVAIALAMTVGVYGLVGAIVKLDDLGLLLLTRPGASRMRLALGRGILVFAPRLLKALSVAGTAAMFLVGGGILVHGLPPLHHAMQHLQTFPFGGIWMAVGNALCGMLLGAIVLIVTSALTRRRTSHRPAAD